MTDQVHGSSGGNQPISYSLKLLVEMLDRAEERRRKAEEGSEPDKQE